MKTRLGHTFLSLLAACSLAVPASAGFDEGWAAYNRGDYAAAVRAWRPLAEKGDPDAQFSLGVMYAEGRGVAQDDKEAVKWYRLSAGQGFAGAQYNLGWMYAEGRGVAQDDKEAVKWYRLSAGQGFAGAQYNLGWMYAQGRGVAQDDKEAVKWYRLSAGQGFAGAQYNLGLMYAEGRGVPQDRVVAYALYNLSAAADPSPDNPATNNRDLLADRMSPRELEAGQALTRELAKPGNFAKALDAYFR